MRSSTQMIADAYAESSRPRSTRIPVSKWRKVWPDLSTTQLEDWESSTYVPKYSPKDIAALRVVYDR